MAGQKNVKYSNATNQTQQFVEEILQKVSKNLPAGAKFSASTWIKGNVDLDEEAKKDLEGGLGLLKDVIGSGNFKIDNELLRNLTGQAEFRVEASVEWDRTKEKESA